MKSTQNLSVPFLRLPVNLYLKIKSKKKKKEKMAQVRKRIHWFTELGSKGVEST